MKPNSQSTNLNKNSSASPSPIRATTSIGFTNAYPSSTATSNLRPTSVNGYFPRTSYSQQSPSQLPPPISPQRVHLSHIPRPFTAVARQPDYISHGAKETYYPNNNASDEKVIGVSLRADGGTVVNYPDGRQAICLSVTQSRDTLSLTSYIYDCDPHHTLLGSFTNDGFGNVQESVVTGPKNTRGRQCFDGHATKKSCQCRQFRSDGSHICQSCGHTNSSHENGRMFLSSESTGFSLVDRRGNRVQPPVMGGTFQLPFELRLNKELVFRISATSEMIVQFQCQGIRHTAELKLRTVRPSKAALIIPTPTPTLSTSYSAPKLHGTTPTKSFGSNRPVTATTATKGGKDQSICSILGSLTDLQQRILSTLTVSHDPAFLTKTFGTSLKKLPSPALVGSPETNLAGLEYNEEFMERNPPLKRGQAIRSASGKYSTEQVVPKNTLKQQPLIQLTNSTYDSTINSEENINKCVGIFCYASYIPASERFEKKLEQIHARLLENEDSYYSLYKFDLSHSRLLIQRYNLRMAPALLVYFNGRLVMAEHLGGVATKHKQRKPTLLLLEDDWSLQTRIEAVLKQSQSNGEGSPFNNVLASSIQDLVRYEALKDSLRYDALLIDLDKFTATEIEQVHRLITRRNDNISAPQNYYSSTQTKFVRPSLPVYVIGMSERPEEEISRYLSFKLGGLVPKPANMREVLKALQTAYSVIAPPVGHTGTDKIDILNLLHHSYQLGQTKKFLPADFTFQPSTDAMVPADFLQRIASGGNMSHSVLNTKPMWTPPPPPPPPPPPVVEEVKTKRKSAKSTTSSK